MSSGGDLAVVQRRVEAEELRDLGGKRMRDYWLLGWKYLVGPQVKLFGLWGLWFPIGVGEGD